MDHCGYESGRRRPTLGAVPNNEVKVGLKDDGSPAQNERTTKDECSGPMGGEKWAGVDCVWMLTTAFVRVNK